MCAHNFHNYKKDNTSPALFLAIKIFAPLEIFSPLVGPASSKHLAKMSSAGIKAGRTNIR